MLRGARDNQQKSSTRSWNLLVFSVGGRRLAAKTDEVAGISKWEEIISVPDQTPNVPAMSRDEQAVLPVYDLAKLLHVRVQGDHLLCLKIKHPRGTMAICIDEEMPVLHTVELAIIQTYRGGEFPSIGSYSSGLDEIPILSMSQLGSA
jgi:chemotaxis signal transduction protein